MDNKYTHKYLNRVLGNSKTRWEMIMVSHGWKQESVMMEGCQAARSARKTEAIQKALTYVYSPPSWKQMPQEKKSASSRPLNVTKKGPPEEGNGYRGETFKVTRARAFSQSKLKDIKALRLAEMNKKNRAENFKNAGYDPFSRRWTRLRNYYVPNATEGDETRYGRREAGGYKCTRGSWNRIKLALHNFDLLISLTELQKFGGATVGKCVPKNDGRRHSLTLTVGDYKPRRGLL
ncbi:hypothetical protein MKW92_004967 [Papaver armeniacum]|nr:hypothetical protein MKW92_004967 [Papaver armeniacum]